MNPLEMDKKSRYQVLAFNENPNIGVSCRANDDVCFIKKGLTKKIKQKISNALQVELVELNIADATIIGSLIAFNSNSAVITDFVDNETVGIIKDIGFDVCSLDGKINAAGNDILMNDKGALVHPNLSDKVIKKIHDTLNVPVKKGTIANLKTVGMTAVVTNKGLLCHPKVTNEEKYELEKLFDVDVMIGTINHGVPLIGSGLVANTKGAIIGNLTTGIEMGRIEEALGFCTK